MADKRYAIIQKKGNCERCRCGTLKKVASEYFGFSMADNPVYVIDTENNREVEPKEFEKELKEVIEYQEKMGWIGG